MTTDILDFDARPTGILPAGILPTDIGAAPVAVPESETVLAVDRWGQRRAADIAERWQAESDLATLASDVPALADAHEALFSPAPVAAEWPADASRAAWWKQMMETPEYRALHNQTMLEPELAEIAAAQVCREWAAYAEQHQPESSRSPATAGQEPPAAGSDEEPIQDTLARMRSTAKALQKAQGEVQTAKDTAAGIGAGDAGTLDPATLRAMFKRVRDDQLLRAIMDMAGRMRSLCRALQRSKVRHGRDDTVGVELGGDITRLVPSELLQLGCGIPEVELQALYRVATRQALCREYRGREKVGRGPIVVSVDESASMEGERTTAAKGLALALAWLAHHQKRWIMLAGYSGDARCTRYVAAPGKSEPAKLLDWCSHLWNGGTVLDGPLATVPGWWPEVRPPKGKVDHIIITDGEVSLPSAMRDSYRAWASAEQVKTYGIIIGCRNAGGIREVADRVWCLPDLNIDSAAVTEVLSI